MPAVSRLLDLCTGHNCWPSRVNDTGSSDVFVNGRGVHRQTDHWGTHCCPDQGCHDSILATGSTTVYVNGLQCSRVGDPIECGSIVMTGSETVFAGG